MSKCDDSKCQGTDTMIYIFLIILMIGFSRLSRTLDDIASKLPQQTIYVTNTVVEYRTNQTAEALAPAKN